MTENGRINYGDLNGGLGNGCGPTPMSFVITVLIILVGLMGLTGCRTIKESEMTNENHKLSELMERMDSMMRTSYTWQQDLYSKQSSLVDSFRHNEKRDSNHVVVINEKGDTVRERIEIYHEVEKDHSSEKQVEEMLVQKIEKLDSMLKVSVEKQAVTDSLLRERDKYKEVEKEKTLGQRISTFFTDAFVCVIIFVLVYIILKVKKKKP